jgi:tRNA wybutosine-synthesizing protein 1
VEGAIARHVAMIKQMKGVPGVKMERWNDAFTVRHCALSLVGEPIMYPHINELLRMLHARRISSFLVTNAQFPDAIAALQPVTQLYVSIDAATKETLRAIDRPLFADFWERFLASLDALRTKGQRTVYRVTLIKGDEGNMKDVAEYAALVARGQPDFIEIKGVTYCGVSDGSSLTMGNVPWHAEVKAFSEALAAQLGGAYAAAVEHAHSCFVLLAKTKFRFPEPGGGGDVWHTHIDYARFHELVQRYYESGGKATFTSLDYVAPTPGWAHYGAPEAGFDPTEVRWRRKQDGSVTEAAYKASESGCG